jgi:DNA polymerase-3 subunit delta'
MQFKDVIGLETQKQQLIKDVQNERISHAQLFLGKMGFGGLPLSLAFVQYLFCKERTSADSCGVCASCKKVSALQHPDLHFSFPTVQAITNTSDPQFTLWREAVMENPYLSLNNWIEKSDEKGRNPIISTHQSQEIIKKLSLKSYEGGYKVSVIWMMDVMNDVSANKLLKIIEEPPAKTIFILLAENQATLMATILSRTQLLKIKQLSDEDLSKWLKNQGVLSSDVIESIVSRADGDINQAIEMLQATGENNENREDFIQLMRVCYKKDVIPMLDWAAKMADKGREQQKNFLHYGLYMVRQSMMKNYTDSQLVRASTEEKAFLEKFARFISGNNVISFSQLFNDAHYSVVRNANAKLLFTNITFEVMRYIHRA